MKNTLTSILFSIFIVSTASAATKYNDLSENYLVNNASQKVREVIAKDPLTSSKILEFLTHDSNQHVRELAIKNLKS